MKGRPKNYRALGLAVTYAQLPPGFDNTDAALLNCLASNGGAIGEKCRPGNVALQAATRLAWSACHVRIEKSIRAGLIERTSVGDGRKNASVYAICYWHPAYPDCGPTGERYSDYENHPVEVDLNQENHPGAPDSMPETIRPNSENHPVDTPKPSGQGTETIRSKGRTISTPHPNPTNPPSKPRAQNAGVAGWLALKAATMGQPTKHERHELEKLIQQHGLAVVQEAQRQFENRPKGLAGLNKPWLLFQTEAPALIPAAKTAVWKASPEYADRQNHFQIQASLLTDTFFPLPLVPWPGMSEDERVLLQKAKAGDWQKGIFLSRAELEILRAMRDRHHKEKEMSDEDFLKTE